MKRTFNADGYYTDIPNFECKSEAFSRYLLDQEKLYIYPMINESISEPVNKEYMHNFKVSVQIEVTDTDVSLAAVERILEESTRQIINGFIRHPYTERITETSEL